MAKILRRYESTIYGNYRMSYLKYGALIGLAMAAYMLLRWAFGLPLKSAEDYGLELILGVGILFFAYRYRKSLPNGQVSFKELMLLGLGSGVVAGAVLCVFVCLYCGVLNGEALADFRESRLALMQEADPAIVDGIRSSSPAYWGLSMGLHQALLGILAAFIGALIFKTEDFKVRNKEKKS